MKNILKHTASCLVALVFAAACGAEAARAQSRDLRVVKAVAGGINFVSGDVKLQTPGQSGWRSLTMRDDLKSGDVLRSGTDGRVEVLLNPGSYLRLGVNSEFELTDASLDKLRLKLYKGSAVVEATGYDGLDISILLDTPQTTVRLVRRGIYRFNVTHDGRTEVAVQKGRALVGQLLLPVRGGEVARVGGGAGSVEVAKLDKNNLDALDLWSKDRAKELARLNRELRERQTRSLLSNANFSRFNGQFGRFGGHGVWVYDTRFNCYTFLPFYSSWSSPYGMGYGHYFPTYPCYSCGGGYNNGWYNNPSAGFPNQPSKSYNPQPVPAPWPSTGGGNTLPITRGGSSGGDRPVAAPVGKSKP